MEKRKRIQWIDVAKGICMLSVVAGHLNVKAINNVVFSYHLTVFFILSGFMLKNNLSRETLVRKFRSLMVPYFVTCLAVTAMDVVNIILLKHTADFAVITEKVGYDLLRSFMASGSIKNYGSIEIGGRIGAIWYLPATFFAVLLVQLLLKYVAQAKYRYAITIALAALACASAPFIWLPFSIQSALLASPFILLGYEWKQNGKLQMLTWKNALVCLVIFLLGVLMKKTPVYYVSASMNDYVISVVCALASSILVIWLSQKIQNCKPLAWVGKNSIYFLCIHLFEMETMGNWFRLLLEKVGLPYIPATRFVVKMVFISLVTVMILWLKKYFSPGQDEKPAIPNKRDRALDVAKAGLIVLMIIGHFDMDTRLRSIIYSFHMAAFIFYSGYCFRPETCAALPKTVWKDIKRFLIPYALFGVGYILVTHDGINVELQRLLLGISFTKEPFQNVGSIGPVYFILLLFVTKVLYLFIERLVPDEKRKALCVLALSCLGVYLGKKGYWLPWSADCALYSLMLYYLGHCFRKYSIMEFLCKRNYSYFLLSCIWAFMIYKSGMEIAQRDYGSYGLAILGAVSASVLLYMACRYLCRVCNKNVVRLISLVGKYTPYIFIAHTLFSGHFGRLVSAVFARDGLYYAVSMLLLQIAAGTVLGMLIAWIQKRFVKPALQTA